jgi:hypothetical protein
MGVYLDEPTQPSCYLRDPAVVNLMLERHGFASAQ